MAKVWLLMHGSYSPVVVGSFATAKQAETVKEALGGDDNDDGQFAVFAVDVLAPEVAVEPVAVVTVSAFSIHWDGKVRTDVELAPRQILRIVGLPADHPRGDAVLEEKPPGPCDVNLSAFEQDYTLGVGLTVAGTDGAAVAQVFAANRAMLLADPAGQVVEAWGVRGQVPEWVWRRPENQGVLDALRAAGIR